MMQSNALRITKNSLSLLFSNVITLAFSFGFFVYIARVLGTSGLGEYSIVRSYLDLFIGLSATAVGIVITREIAQKPDLANRYLSVSIVFVSLLSFIACFILIIIGWVSNYSVTTQISMTVACLALIPSSIAQVIQASFIGLEKAEYVSYMTVIENVMRIGLSLLVLYLGFGLVAVFIVFVIVRIGLLLLYYNFLRRLIDNLKWDFDNVSLKRFVMDWKVFAVENWLSNIQGNLDVILLSWFGDETAVGLYAAASKLMALGGTVILSITTAIYPYLSRLYKESKDAFQLFSETFIKYLLATVLPPAIIIAILANQIVILLYSTNFVGSVPILEILIGVMVIKYINLPLSYILFSRGDQKKSLQVAAISLPVYLIIGLWFAKHWSAIGVAIALLITTLVAFGLYFSFTFYKHGLGRQFFVLARIVIAGGLMGFTILFLRQFISNPILIPLAIFSYIGFLILSKVVATDELFKARTAIHKILGTTHNILQRLINREVT